MKYLFRNNATSFLAIDTGDTSATLSLMAGEGERFPQPVGDGSDGFMVTIEDRRNETLEICRCIGRSTDILNVVRAQEGTTAKIFKRGSTVSVRLTAEILEYFRGIVDAAGDKYTQVEADARFVNAAGDVMTGPLSLSSAPTDSTHAVNKQYADTTFAPMVHTHTIPQVTGLQASQDAQDAVTATKEPTIVAGGIDQYWRGDKTWAPSASLMVDAYTKADADLRFAQIAGQVFTGPVTLPGDPLQPLQAVTKQYVDANLGAPAWVDITGKPATFPPSAHTHTTAEVVGLQSELDGKAATVHTHTTAQVTGLDTALAGKAPTVHTHTTAQVTGLDTALAARELLITPGDPAKFWAGDKTWKTVSGGGGGGGIEEAPADGRVYNRRGSDTSWQPASSGGGGSFDTAADYQLTGLWMFGPASGLGGSGQITIRSQQFIDQTGNATTSIQLDNATISSDWTQNDLQLVSPMGNALVFMGDGSDELRYRGKPLVTDVNMDGVIYARQDRAWVEVAGGGGGISEAPTDGSLYLRKGSDASWQPSATMPVAWTAITGKPSTFPPTLPIAQSGITNLTTDLAAKLDKAGGTMTGPIALAADPSTSMQAATKQYVDTKVAAVSIPDGDKGDIVVSGSGSSWMFDSAVVTAAAKTVLDDPSTAAMLTTLGGMTQATADARYEAIGSGYTKAETDAKYVELAGDTVTGPLFFNNTSASAPMVQFGGTMSGLYGSTGGVHVAIGGTAKLQIMPTVTTSGNPFEVPNGTAAAPGLAFAGQQLGLWRVTTNAIGVSVGGTNRFTFTNGDHTSNNPILLPSDPTNVLHAATKQYVDGKAGITQAAADLRYEPLDSAYTKAEGDARYEPIIAAGDPAMYWAGDKTWKPVSSGGVAISDTPPASPTDGQQWFESDSGGMFIRYNDGTSSQWIQTNGAGIADAPSDGAEYVRVNGVWRKKSQTFVADGLTQLDIDVPPTAKLLRLEASIWWAAVSANNSLTWRASLDGTTFLAGASDYFYGGLIHYNGSAGYANLPGTNEAYGRLTFPGDTTTQPVRSRWLFQVLKSTNTSALHAGTVNSGYYNTPATNSYTDLQITTGVQSGATLGIKKLRFFNGPVGGAFGNGSFIVCEWMY